MPLQLKVRDHSLPVWPYAKTMLAMDFADINQRYTGVAWPSYPQMWNYPRLHLQQMHRHGLTPVSSDFERYGVLIS